MPRHARVRGFITAILAAAVLASLSTASAQTRTSGDADNDQAFVEALRREDPANADRYVALRDARAQALAELRKTETQYNGAGPQLRGLFVNALKQARKKYAETSLALLDFFDSRDKTNIDRYREEIANLTRLIGERQKTRAELEKLLAP